ncbi:MAG: hypothetical protein R3F56_08825 [Planctomycetota bacterium]
MRHAPHDTRLGQLQRGRGAGFLAALAQPAAARDEVLGCVLEDPRIDAQIEARGAYYAELAHRIDVDVAPMVRRAAAADGWLAVDVLVELAARGHSVATNLLTCPEREPEAATAVLKDLVAHGEWAVSHLELPAAAFLAEQLDAADELVHAVEIDGEFWNRWRSALWRVERAFVDAAAQAAVAAALAPEPVRDLDALATEDLILRAQYGQSGWKRARQVLERRDSELEREVLADVVTHAHEGSSAVIAARTLGSFGDLRLLASAEATFARTDLDFSGTANAIERQRRAALLHYVKALPPATVLPLARRWWPRGGYLRVAAGAVLRRHAEAVDREWLEEVVARTLGPACDRVINEIEALRRIGDVRTLPVLIRVAEQSTYSFARGNALLGVAAHAQEAQARIALHEALWDSEDVAVELACTHADLRPVGSRARIAEIVAAPLVPPEVHLAALSRALA